MVLAKESLSSRAIHNSCGYSVLCFHGTMCLIYNKSEGMTENLYLILEMLKNNLIIALMVPIQS